MLKNAKREIVRNEYGSAEVYYIVTNDSEYELEVFRSRRQGMDANGTTIDTGSGNEINILQEKRHESKSCSRTQVRFMN